MSKLFSIEQNKKIEERDDYQFGFRKNRSNSEAILTLKLILEKQIRVQKQEYIVFVNLVTAFDNVN